MADSLPATTNPWKTDSVFGKLPTDQITVGDRTFIFPDADALVALKDRTLATLPDDKKTEFDNMFGGLFHLVGAMQVKLSRAEDALRGNDQRGFIAMLEQATEDLEVAALRAEKIENRYFVEATANPA